MHNKLNLAINSLVFMVVAAVAFMAVYIWSPSVAIDIDQPVHAGGLGQAGRGYNTNIYDPNGGQVFPGGLGYNAASNSGFRSYDDNAFINDIRNRLFGGNARNQTGAAFIVNLINGHHSHAGTPAAISTARSEFSSFESKVLASSYQSGVMLPFGNGDWNTLYQGVNRAPRGSADDPGGGGGSVQYTSRVVGTSPDPAAAFCSSVDAGGFGFVYTCYYPIQVSEANPNDNAFYQTPSNFSEMRPSIVITSPNGRFIIKQNCGNPMKEFRSPPDTPPPTEARANCTDAGPVGLRVRPGQVFTVAFETRNDGNTTWIRGTDNLGSTNPRDTLRFPASSSGVSPVSSPNRVGLTGNVSPGQTAGFIFNVTAPSNPGNYEMAWGMVHEGASPFWYDGNGSGSTNCRLGFVVESTTALTCTLVANPISGTSPVSSRLNWSANAQNTVINSVWWDYDGNGTWDLQRSFSNPNDVFNYDQYDRTYTSSSGNRTYNPRVRFGTTTRGTAECSTSVRVTAPAVPQASGTLSCGAVTTNSIQLNFQFTNGSSVQLRRNNSTISNLGSGNRSGARTDTGRSPGTQYTYTLVSSGTELARVNCSTQTPGGPPPASGSIACAGVSASAITVNYSFSNASNVTLRRNGATFASIGGSSGSGSRTDSGRSASTTYAYTIYNGNSQLASVNCTTSGGGGNPPAGPSGTLACAASSSSSITLRYTYNNGSNVSLFNGTRRVATFGSGNGSSTRTDVGLNSNTTYTFTLRNGTRSNSTQLASRSCSTTRPPAPPPSGNLTCTTATPSSVSFNYSFANATGNVSVFRGSSLVTSFGSGGNSGSFTVRGLSENTPYTLTLRNGTSSGSSSLSSDTCRTTIQPRFWDYRASTSSSSPRQVIPGQLVTISSTVRNVGDGTGQGYTLTLNGANIGNAFIKEATTPNSSGSTEAIWSGQSALAVGQTSGATSASYRVANNAQSGTYCFTARVSPSEGQSRPVQTTQSGSSHTSSPPICFEVFADRYELENPVVSISDTEAYVGDQVTITYFVDNTGVGDVTDQNGNITDVSSPEWDFSGLGVTPIAADNVQINGRGGDSFNRYSIDRTFTVPADAPLGEYCVQGRFAINPASGPNANITGFEGFTNTEDGPLNTERRCITILDFRYLEVHGAPLVAGGWYDTLGNCLNAPTAPSLLDPTNGSITSIIRGTVGSSTQYAAIALGEISGFASGTPRNTTARDRNALTFANDPTDGSFASRGECLPNMYDALREQAESNGSFSGAEAMGQAHSEKSQVRVLNDGTLPGSGNFGGKVILVRDGDLNITNNIAYTGNYGVNAASTPALVVIVRGNINISNAVTQLDGLYISIPNGASGGEIDTCSEAEGAYGAPGVCDNQLTINGAFMANYVDFDRTFGGFSASLDAAADGSRNTDFAAEIFEFSPELYIANPFDDVIFKGEGVGTVEILLEQPPTF